jgi:hypothetical protein
MSQPKPSYDRSRSPKLSKSLKQIPAKKARTKTEQNNSSSTSIAAKTQKKFKSLVELLKRTLSEQPNHLFLRT